MRLIDPMDEKSAISVLNRAVTYNGCGRATSDDMEEAIKLAKEALKKQIPKKVEKQQWIDTVCECGRVFSKHHGDGYHSIPYENQTKYCPECGQALDWEEGGEE